FVVCFMIRFPWTVEVDCLVTGSLHEPEPATDTLANSVAMPWQKVQTARVADESRACRKAMAPTSARAGDTSTTKRGLNRVLAYHGEKASCPDSARPRAPDQAHGVEAGGAMHAVV